MQSFTCKGCGKKSKLSGIRQLDDITYVICEFCKAKNKLHPLPKSDGAPIQFKVVGVLK